MNILLGFFLTRLCIVISVTIGFSVTQLPAMEAIEAVVTTDPGADLYPDVKKLTDNFYVGKIKDKELWLVMERIHDDATLTRWRHYARIQSKHEATMIGKSLVKSFTSDGSAHFNLVLQEENLFPIRETWIAYITSNPHPKPIVEEDDVVLYKVEDLSPPQNSFAKNIHMFVTITSSPNALITTHLGVSKSIEGLQQNQPQISMDLHSFAAKVMLMRNPLRKYMVNAPAFAMERIMAQSLPNGSVFVGTREMQTLPQERSAVTLEDFKAANSERIKSLERSVNGKGVLLKNALKDLEKEKVLIQDGFNKGDLTKDEYDKYMRELNDETKEVSDKLENWENDLQKNIEKGINKLFLRSKNSFDSFKGWKDMETLDKVWETYPPLLSVDHKGRKFIDKQFIIFDKEHPDQPWLTVGKDNLDYDWMFNTNVFGPAGSTHFVVVDLLNLAQLKSLDPLSMAG